MHQFAFDVAALEKVGVPIDSFIESWKKNNPRDRVRVTPTGEVVITRPVWNPEDVEISESE